MFVTMKSGASWTGGGDEEAGILKEQAPAWVCEDCSRDHGAGSRAAVSGTGDLEGHSMAVENRKPMGPPADEQELAWWCEDLC